MEDLQVTLQVKVISCHKAASEEGSLVAVKGGNVGDIEGILLRPGIASTSSCLEDANVSIEENGEGKEEEEEIEGEEEEEVPRLRVWEEQLPAMRHKKKNCVHIK